VLIRLCNHRVQSGSGTAQTFPKQRLAVSKKRPDGMSSRRALINKFVCASDYNEFDFTRVDKSTWT